MCNGIAILVYEKNGRLKGLCNGERHHDVLCKEDEELRLGKIEPYRFELYYPANIVFDRGAPNQPLASGLFGEQPPEKVFDVAFEVGRPFFFKHKLDQLYAANLRHADLEDANLIGADLRHANLIGANLRHANLIGANLIGANLEDANLEDANLIGADLRHANLIGADLRHANLRRANLRRADLSGANLRDIITDEYTILPKI
jgi:hypothetical protein